MDQYTEYILDMHRRDSFIFPDTKCGLYYLYFISEMLGDDGTRDVLVQTSQDLLNWSMPKTALAAEVEFRGTPDIRSPRVFFHRGSYFLVASFRYESMDWSCQFFRSSNPLGPFRPIGSPVTPAEGSAADGVLFLDVRGSPWLVYTKQPAQSQDDEICAIRLTEELSQQIGEETVLFRASEATWGQVCLSEDGRNWRRAARSPVPYRCQDFGLILLWTGDSSVGSAVGCAWSASGELDGPWTQIVDPVYGMDGGGASLFTDFDGRLVMMLYSPTEEGIERILLFEMEEKGGSLQIVNELTGNWYPKAYRADGTMMVMKP